MDDYGASCPCGWATTEKDPDDIVWLTFLWAGLLNGDVIATRDYLLPDGLAEVSDDIDATQQSTRVKVSGGSACNVYRVTNRIVTTGGQTMDQTQYVKIRER